MAICEEYSETEKHGCSRAFRAMHATCSQICH
ncbi:uncharacterized protein G2W53_021467 [Senna tora]|uniref:Uncharacterized protein n=1 Tax=Senna tora TaxID=362788 RepID=A0A834WJL4_9FABA|nr:uncharacterized protein G2W53_021467 [Senna tora]